MLKTLLLSAVLLVATLGSAQTRADDLYEVPPRGPQAQAADRALALQVAPEVRKAWALQRRGRLMMAFGIASLVSSAVFLIWASQTAPSDDPGGLTDGDIIAGSVLGGIGAGLTIGGSLAWTQGARRAKRPPDEREKARLAGFSILTMGVTQAGFAIGRLIGSGFCSS